MSRIYIHGRLQQFTRYVNAIPWLEQICDDIENAINGQIDGTNIAQGGVLTGNIADGAVTASKLAALSVTSAALDSTVPRIATGQYTGDATSNREINLGFRARYVSIIRGDNATRFQAWGSTVSALARIQTVAAGTTSDGGTDFTGCSTNGFTLGSAAGGGASNANAVLFTYMALG